MQNLTGETICRLGNQADGCQGRSRISHLAFPTSTCTGDPVPGREGRTQPGAADKMPLRSQGPEAGAGSELPSARLSPASAKRGCFRNQIRAAFRNLYCNLPGILCLLTLLINNLACILHVFFIYFSSKPFLSYFIETPIMDRVLGKNSSQHGVWGALSGLGVGTQGEDEGRQEGRHLPGPRGCTTAAPASGAARGKAASHPGLARSHRSLASLTRYHVLTPRNPRFKSSLCLLRNLISRIQPLGPRCPAHTGTGAMWPVSQAS